MKLPALQFYPADWRKDPGVQSLNYFDRGVWFEILCLMHESSERGKLLLNGKAMPDDALARVLGLDNQILSTTLTTLLTYGVASRDDETGALINRRMVSDDRLRKIRAEAGKKGGNPALLNQKPATGDKQIPTTLLKQIPTPSSSISTSVKDQQRRGARLPDSFSVSEDLLRFASKEAPGVDVERALAEFKDYWKAVPGAKGCKLDWDATFRNRLRELASRKGGGNGYAPSEHPNAHRPGKMVL